VATHRAVHRLPLPAAAERGRRRRANRLEHREDRGLRLRRTRVEKVLHRNEPVRGLVVDDTPVHRSATVGHRPDRVEADELYGASRASRVAGSLARHDAHIRPERARHRDHGAKLWIRRRCQQTADARRMLADLPRQVRLAQAMLLAQCVELVDDRVDLRAGARERAARRSAVAGVPLPCPLARRLPGTDRADGWSVATRARKSGWRCARRRRDRRGAGPDRRRLPLQAGRPRLPADG
jgi:hypothetical protein